ncbi:double-strand break repair helicase AddA [Thalassococcus sp. BH17M4-6]|uniref:double-strand break repair helicase AddA n=1 Tax=Thalassococcus sp. BH17M4-6 TaxID=3413148 RepID=UPI003BC916C7
MRDDATDRQVQAARPDRSTWLSANAGSGKTRVLTDRVARLLLDGVQPEHILCLTYTKAAASEMQNRLFKRLGAWAMLADAALADELRQLGVEVEPTQAFLRRARTLFARAIETPGGLRIQTIHSFCAALLRRFPLEAQVSPQFAEMEDRAAELLRADILDRLSDGPEAGVVADLAQHLTTDTPEDLLKEIAGNHDAFWPPRAPGDIRALYGLGPDADDAQVLASVFLGGEIAFLAELIAALSASGSTDQKAAAKLREVRGADLPGLLALEAAFLVKSGDNLGKISSRAVTKGILNGPLGARLTDLMRRVEAARDQRLALAAADRDLALHRFAQVFLPAYEAEKQRRGWLDFDDLIDKARQLLSDARVAEWVLYRLDGGIDHILVDEAQDTSPRQWQVIERLAQEFTAGEGARTDVRRTIFVVGDKKQSIYSFQGADPREFDRMRDDFAARLAATDQPLRDLTLEYSFRSADPILQLVDHTFPGREAAGFSADQRHRAFKAAMPGRVDLWPHIASTPEEKDGDWFDPVDRVSERHHSVLLAQRIARFMSDTIAARTPLPVEIGQTGEYEARPITAGDFLILVRGRSRLFSEIIRACKQAGLPIAGADRLKVMAELAVRDIGALLSFLATPEDDLALATALRSPLFGLSEQQLFTLAHRRGKAYLWEHLRQNRDTYAPVLAVIDDLRGQTDFLRPFDLIERILTRHQGRKRLLGRLGDEAEDGINALLQQALAYEQTQVPSLTGFLQWMQTDDLEIKRAADSAGGRVRVMTVHGAKGLEAPIVILPDCAQPRTGLRGQLLGGDGGAVWKARSDAMPELHRNREEAAKAADARERDRLLYVALTRAEKWLIVAAAGNLGTKGESWYDQVQAGMDATGAVPATFDFGDLGSGEGLTLGQADWSGLSMTDIAKVETPDIPLPDLFQRPPPPPQDPPKARIASDLGGAKALAGPDGDDEDTATRRGTLIHLLLEHLPQVAPPAHETFARRVLQTARMGVTDAEAPALIEEALGVLSTPALAPLFAPEALTEVPLTGDIAPLGQVFGVIDRLLITPEKITAVDFKTNRTLPTAAADCPESVLRQMGAYHALLAALYPGRAIEVGILWTRSAHYMPLPHALVTQALARAATP